MLIRNPEHLNQIGCHINMAMFLEISVFGQGAVVLWCCGAVVLWRCGAVALWCCGTVVLWCCGAVVLWRCGAVVLWCCGAVVLWCSHSEREVALLRLILKSCMFRWNWQQCNLFVNKSAGTSVWYTTFPVIHSTNCCNTRGIEVKSIMAVLQLRWNRGRV